MEGSPLGAPEHAPARFNVRCGSIAIRRSLSSPGKMQAADLCRSQVGARPVTIQHKTGQVSRRVSLAGVRTAGFPAPSPKRR